MTSVHGMTNVYLAPECNEFDRTWVSLMLQAAEIEAEVVKTCSCGFATECAMHCNHDLSDKCTGPSYFELNGIETKVAVKATPQSPDLQLWRPTYPKGVIAEDNILDCFILEDGKKITKMMYYDLEAHGELDRVLAVVREQMQEEERRRWRERSVEVIEVWSGESSEPVAFYHVGGSTSSGAM